MVSDAQIQRAVLAGRARDRSITVTQTGLAGVAPAAGSFETAAKKRTAVRRVMAAPETIQVRSPFRGGDRAIAPPPPDRMARGRLVPPDPMIIKADKGWITRAVDDRCYYQREAAGSERRRSRGGLGLSGASVVASAADVTDISIRIRKALHRSWLLDEETVTVIADGGAVHLSGTVHSPHEWRVASQAALAAPGVTSVTNDIAIFRWADGRSR
jgi:hypothetical protein